MANDANRLSSIRLLSLRLALLPLDIKIWLVTALIWMLSVMTVFSIFDIFGILRWRLLEWEKFLTILLLPAAVSGIAISGYRWAVRTSNSDLRSQLVAQYNDLKLLARNKRSSKKTKARVSDEELDLVDVSIPADLRKAFESHDTSPEMQEHIKARVGSFARELADQLMLAKSDVLDQMVRNSAEEFSRHGSIYADTSKAFDDFVHAYLAAPEHAERAAPRFFRKFDDFLKSELPGVFGTFRDTADMYRLYAEIVLSNGSDFSDQKQASSPQTRKHRRMPASLLGFGSA